MEKYSDIRNLEYVIDRAKSQVVSGRAKSQVVSCILSLKKKCIQTASSLKVISLTK